MFSEVDFLEVIYNSNEISTILCCHAEHSRSIY